MTASVSWVLLLLKGVSVCTLLSLKTVNKLSVSFTTGLYDDDVTAVFPVTVDGSEEGAEVIYPRMNSCAFLKRVLSETWKDQDSVDGMKELVG